MGANTRLTPLQAKELLEVCHILITQCYFTFVSLLCWNFVTVISGWGAWFCLHKSAWSLPIPVCNLTTYIYFNPSSPFFLAWIDISIMPVLSCPWFFCVPFCRYSLIGLREHIKKRPPLATTEKVQQFVKVGHVVYHYIDWHICLSAHPDSPLFFSKNTLLGSTLC